MRKNIWWYACEYLVWIQPLYIMYSVTHNLFLSPHTQTHTLQPMHHIKFFHMNHHHHLFLFAFYTNSHPLFVIQKFKIFKYTPLFLSMRQRRQRWCWINVDDSLWTIFSRIRCVWCCASTLYTQWICFFGLVPSSYTEQLGPNEYMCAKEGMDVYLQPKYDALFLYVHRATS